MQVTQLINDNGYPARNQFVIIENGLIIFQSYRSKIAVLDNGKITLGVDWNVSNCTRKHLYIFLRNFAKLSITDGKKDVERYVKEGRIKLSQDF